MAQQICIVILAEVPDGATAGTDYGDQPLTPEFIQEYLTGAYVGEGAVPLAGGTVVLSVTATPLAS